MATTPTARTDFDHSEAVATNDWNTKYPFFSRIASGLASLWEAKQFTGTEPDDKMTGLFLSDGTLNKAVRIQIDSSKNYTIARNTGDDTTPIWTTVMFTINGSTELVTLAGALAMGSNAITGIAGITLSSGNADLGAGGIVNAGAIAGATTVTASGLATLGSILLSSGGANLANGGISNAGNIGGIADLAFASGGASITSLRTTTAVLDFPNTSAQQSASLTIGLTGVLVGQAVILGPPTISANTAYTAFVSGTNVVTVRFHNYSSGSINPASGTFRVWVFGP